jgi:hypothetical protein
MATRALDRRARCDQRETHRRIDQKHSPRMRWRSVMGALHRAFGDHLWRIVHARGREESIVMVHHEGKTGPSVRRLNSDDRRRSNLIIWSRTLQKRR